jgi:iron complex transport system ATP-binding protein
MIRASQITVRRGGRMLLSEVGLEIRPGEVLVLLGPNGAGKSTLLRVLSGEWAPPIGEVTLRGRTLADWNRRELARVRALLPQESRLSFALPALEVALLGRYPHNGGRHGGCDLVIAKSALELTGTGHLAGRSYPTLSGGERARVQLARCLCQIWDAPEGRCLLLDEPTANLDPAHQHAALAIARRFASETGAAVAVVLHDLNLAAQYADRIAILERGRLAACGPPWEVLTASRLAGVFGIEVQVLRRPEGERPLIATAAAAPTLPGQDAAG